ncbi:hypothetical protein COCON_G00103710, partial [Conger conger]
NLLQPSHEDAKKETRKRQERDKKEKERDKKEAGVPVLYSMLYAPVRPPPSLTLSVALMDVNHFLANSCSLKIMCRISASHVPAWNSSHLVQNGGKRP